MKIALALSLLLSLLLSLSHTLQLSLSQAGGQHEDHAPQKPNGGRGPWRQLPILRLRCVLVCVCVRERERGRERERPLAAAPVSELAEEVARDELEAPVS